MLCYKDKCWCDTKDCKHYDTCEETMRFAAEEQKNNVPWEDWLPFATRKFTKQTCSRYEKGLKVKK